MERKRLTGNVVVKHGGEIGAFDNGEDSGTVDVKLEMIQPSYQLAGEDSQATQAHGEDDTNLFANVHAQSTDHVPGDDG